MLLIKCYCGKQGDTTVMEECYKWIKNTIYPLITLLESVIRYTNVLLYIY